MNDFAKQWVADLRSGKFEQCYKVLCRDGKYCCLGVAIQRFIKPVYYGDAVIFGEESNKDVDGPGVEYLTSGVRDKLDLSDSQGRFHVSDAVRGKLLEFDVKLEANVCYLTTLNDRFNLTFSQIADIIEMEPPELFTDKSS